MSQKQVVAHPTNTELSFHTSKDRPVARYVSDTTVCEEALAHGRWIGVYWSATGHVHRENVTETLPPAFLESFRHPLHAFELEMDGQSLHNRWDWIGATTRPGRKPGTFESVVELKHQVRPVTLKVVTCVDGSPILARYLEITNTGAAPAALASVSPWSGVLWVSQTEPANHFENVNPAFDEKTQAKFSLGYMAGERWGEEGNFTWQSLPRDSFRVERKASGRQHSSPYFVIDNAATGERFFLGLAWSGNYMLEVSYRYDTILSFRVAPLGPAPLRVIAPGETVTSPEVHMGPVHGSMDETVAHWHQHMRASVVPPRPKGRESFVVAGRVVEHPNQWILTEVDIAAEMGAEAFMVDAGWYGEKFSHWWDLRGDWNEGDWLPGGIAGIRRHTQDKGLLFGLWHEAEAISQMSQLYKDHPDWILKTDDNRAVTTSLDLANPAAAKYYADSVHRIVKEHELDFYKLDYNLEPGEGGQTVTNGYAEAEIWRHLEKVYATYEQVVKDNPNVCLENCAGGGGRNDLGMVSRFHYSCESDWSAFPYSIRAINALTLFIPPEALAYYHNHMQHAHTTADLDTHLRVTLFVGVPIYVGFGAQDADRTTPYFQQARRYIALHKGFCRQVLSQSPVVYHHTPDLGLFQKTDWCVLEYAAPDGLCGYAGVFKLTSGPSDYLLRLRGVDLGAHYEVTLDNRGQSVRMRGSELAETGLRIRRDTALTSELVMYRQVTRRGRTGKE